MRKGISNDKSPYLAAIDIGTNSFHLVVVEILDGEKFRIIDRAKENVRLGSGAKDMKYIAADAIDRGITTLRRFGEIARTYRAPIRAVATSAVREALNRQEFVRKARESAGIRIDVVSGFEEARLIYLGVLQALPVYHHPILLMDIGGGSVEYLIGRKGDVQYANSLKLGCIRLTQRFFRNGPLRDPEIRACRNHVEGFLAPVARDTDGFAYDFAIGSSGTIQNIAYMIRAIRGEIMSPQVNNFSFSREELKQVVKAILKARTAKHRLRIEGLDPKRVDIIVAGAIVLEESFKALGIKRMTVSEFALREGVIYDYLQKRVFQADRKHHLANIRYRSVLKLAETFHYDERHSRQTARLAVRIFDESKELHGLGDTEREFLEYASLLHEIGFFVSHAQHHRHSYYLIRNAELLGFTDNEIEIIANVARYHRKSHPKAKHEGFSKLGPTDQGIVRKLAGILRLADGLDRSHEGHVRDLTCKIQNRHVVLKLKTKNKVELERWALNMKKALFEEVFRRKVEVKS